MSSRLVSYAAAQAAYDRNRAFLSSVVFHALLLALLFFYRFSAEIATPPPPPIEIQFGGGGDDAAAGAPDAGQGSDPVPEGQQLTDPSSTVPVPEPTPEPIKKVTPSPSQPTPTPPVKTTTTTDPTGHRGANGQWWWCGRTLTWLSGGGDGCGGAAERPLGGHRRKAGPVAI